METRFPKWSDNYPLYDYIVNKYSSYVNYNIAPIIEKDDETGYWCWKNIRCLYNGLTLDMNVTCSRGCEWMRNPTMQYELIYKNSDIEIDGNMGNGYARITKVLD